MRIKNKNITMILLILIISISSFLTIMYGNINIFNSNISFLYYTLIIIQCTLLSCIIVYLILSNFNKKTVKETMENSDKIVMYILSVAILTIALSITLITISKDLSIKL